VRAANGDPYKIGSARSEYQALTKKKPTNVLHPVGAGEARDLLILSVKSQKIAGSYGNVDQGK
jgi:hypothetical protein